MNKDTACVSMQSGTDRARSLLLGRPPLRLAGVSHRQATTHGHLSNRTRTTSGIISVTCTVQSQTTRLETPAPNAIFGSHKQNVSSNINVTILRVSNNAASQTAPGAAYAQSSPMVGRDGGKKEQGEQASSRVQSRHAMEPHAVVHPTLQREEGCTCIQTTLERGRGSFLASHANPILYPSDLVDHEAEAVMSPTLSAGNAMLDGACVLLQSGQNENFDLQVHVGGRRHRSGGHPFERFFCVRHVIGRGDARVKHGYIHRLVPFPSNPTGMNGGSDGIRIVAIDTCTPQMTL